MKTPEYDRIIKQSDLFWNGVDPKNPSKFVCYITDTITGEQIVPSYVIHTVERPNPIWQHAGWEEKRKVWNNIEIQCYEPLGLNILMKLNSATNFNLRVCELTGTGEVAEEWELMSCRFESIDPEPLSWNSNNALNSSIKCEVKYNAIKVNTDIKKEGK